MAASARHRKRPGKTAKAIIASTLGEYGGLLQEIRGRIRAGQVATGVFSQIAMPAVP